MLHPRVSSVLREHCLLKGKAGYRLWVVGLVGPENDLGAVAGNLFRRLQLRYRHPTTNDVFGRRKDQRSYACQRYLCMHFKYL